MMDSILIVEDDIALASITADYLRLHNFSVELAHDGVAARECIQSRVGSAYPYSLIILDVMLPGVDGLELCRELRRSGVTTPIVILTARDDDIDIVLGLEFGADDYLSKPVQPRVLLARIKALLRRTNQTDTAAPILSPDQLSFGELVINRSSRSVRLSMETIDLTTAEFDLLWLLASNAGRILPRHEILRELRGLEYDGVDRSIDSRVSRLRRKLGDDSVVTSHIKTVRPHGYFFSPENWSS
jgi:DNA-binding response OmpR family regulator